jgi:hypothetical protein
MRNLPRVWGRMNDLIAILNVFVVLVGIRPETLRIISVSDDRLAVGSVRNLTLRHVIMRVRPWTLRVLSVPICGWATI